MYQSIAPLYLLTLQISIWMAQPTRTKNSRFVYNHSSVAKTSPSRLKALVHDHIQSLRDQLRA